MRIGETWVARIVCMAALTALATGAHAHAHLSASVPADGSVLREPPTNFVLTFAEPARVTMLSLQKDSGPAQKLGPLPSAAAREVSIPAPRLASGRYLLSWRVVGQDGHVMPGKLTFTISGGERSSAARQ